MKGYPLVFALIALPFFALGLYLTAGFCRWCVFPGILPFATFVGFGPGLFSLFVGYLIWKRRRQEH
ncbi:MAG: hypothetical protein K0S06_3987 [Microvirga sp.]|nr:hypothetical protein [Microvirga sp.]